MENLVQACESEKKLTWLIWTTSQKATLLERINPAYLTKLEKEYVTSPYEIMKRSLELHLLQQTFVSIKGTEKSIGFIQIFPSLANIDIMIDLLGVKDIEICAENNICEPLTFLRQLPIFTFGQFLSSVVLSHLMTSFMQGSAALSLAPLSQAEMKLTYALQALKCCHFEAKRIMIRVSKAFVKTSKEFLSIIFSTCKSRSDSLRCKSDSSLVPLWFIVHLLENGNYRTFPRRIFEFHMMPIFSVCTPENQFKALLLDELLELGRRKIEEELLVEMTSYTPLIDNRSSKKKKKKKKKIKEKVKENTSPESQLIFESKVSSFSLEGENELNPIIEEDDDRGEDEEELTIDPAPIHDDNQPGDIQEVFVKDDVEEEEVVENAPVDKSVFNIFDQASQNDLSERHIYAQQYAPWYVDADPSRPLQDRFLYPPMMWFTTPSFINHPSNQSLAWPYGDTPHDTFDESVMFPAQTLQYDEDREQGSPELDDKFLSMFESHLESDGPTSQQSSGERSKRTPSSASHFFNSNEDMTRRLLMLQLKYLISESSRAALINKVAGYQTFVHHRPVTAVDHIYATPPLARRYHDDMVQAYNAIQVNPSQRPIATVPIHVYSMGNVDAHSEDGDVKVRAASGGHGSHLSVRALLPLKPLGAIHQHEIQPGFKSPSLSLPPTPTNMSMPEHRQPVKGMDPGLPARESSPSPVMMPSRYHFDSVRDEKYLESSLSSEITFFVDLIDRHESSLTRFVSHIISNHC